MVNLFIYLNMYFKQKILKLYCKIYERFFGVNHEFVDAFRTNQCDLSSGQVEETDPALHVK